MGPVSRERDSFPAARTAPCACSSSPFPRGSSSREEREKQSGPREHRAEKREKAARESHSREERRAPSKEVLHSLLHRLHRAVEGTVKEVEEEEDSVFPHQSHRVRSHTAAATDDFALLDEDPWTRKDGSISSPHAVRRTQPPSRDRVAAEEGVGRERVLEEDLYYPHPTTGTAGLRPSSVASTLAAPLSRPETRTPSAAEWRGFGAEIEARQLRWQEQQAKHLEALREGFLELCKVVREGLGSRSPGQGTPQSCEKDVPSPIENGRPECEASSQSSGAEPRVSHRGMHSRRYRYGTNSFASSFSPSPGRVRASSKPHSSGRHRLADLPSLVEYTSLPTTTSASSEEGENGGHSRPSLSAVVRSCREKLRGEEKRSFSGAEVLRWLESEATAGERAALASSLWPSLQPLVETCWQRASAIQAPSAALPSPPPAAAAGSSGARPLSFASPESLEAHLRAVARQVMREGRWGQPSTSLSPKEQAWWRDGLRGVEERAVKMVEALEDRVEALSATAASGAAADTSLLRRVERLEAEMEAMKLEARTREALACQSEGTVVARDQRGNFEESSTAHVRRLLQTHQQLVDSLVMERCLAFESRMREQLLTAQQLGECAKSGVEQLRREVRHGFGVWGRELNVASPWGPLPKA